MLSTHHRSGRLLQLSARATRLRGMRRPTDVSLPRTKGVRRGEGSQFAVLLVPAIAIVIITYWPVLSAKAAYLDDEKYVTHNYLVRNPSWASLERFFTEILEPSSVRGYYCPLTMASLMLDYRLGGRTNQSVFRITNLILHACNTALIAVLLNLLLRQPLVAVFLALLFAIHPVTVEAVAWVSQRKTLLASFFALSSQVLYVRYTLAGQRSRYVASVGLFVLALMSKPTCVPLPILLLLFDYWPLKRLGMRSVREKLPFFLLAGLSVIITIVSQRRTAGIIMPNRSFASILLLVLHNTFYNSALYFRDIVWPFGLPAHYSFPNHLDPSHPLVLTGLGGAIALIGILAVSPHHRPSLIAGCGYFLAALSPTLGFIGFTSVIAANHYVYLPMFGLLLASSAALGNVIRRMGKRVCWQSMAIVVLVLVCGLESIQTRWCLSHWANTAQLYRQLLKRAPRSSLLHTNLGVALMRNGNLDSAVARFEKALEIEPDDALARNSLGVALIQLGATDEAIRQFSLVIKDAPDFAVAHVNLGNALVRQGDIPASVAYFENAIRISPDYAEAHSYLGAALLHLKETDRAIEHLRLAVCLDPRDALAHYNLGTALLEGASVDMATEEFEIAVGLDPGSAKMKNALDWVESMKARD